MFFNIMFQRIIIGILIQREVPFAVDPEKSKKTLYKITETAQNFL